MSTEIDYLSLIKSTDIDKSKLTNEQVKAVVEAFPNADIKIIANHLQSNYGDTELTIKYLTKVLAWRDARMPILKQDALEEIKVCVGYEIDGKRWTEHVSKLMPEDKSKCVLLMDRTDASSYSQDMEFFKYFISQYGVRIFCFVFVTS